jgi:hypothetical protein
VHFSGVQVINGDPRHSDHRLVIICTEEMLPRGEGDQEINSSTLKRVGWERRNMLRW